MHRHHLILLLAFGLAAQLAAADPVRIGILAKDGPTRCIEMWGETASYLQAKIPGQTFTIVPLAFDAIYPALEKGDVSFAVLNPGMSLTARDRFGTTAIATLTNLRNGKPVTVFGGVIFTRADQTGINSLADLKGKRFQAVKKSSFGGWLAGWKELADGGVVPEKDFAHFEFVEKHENVVLNVLNGKADAGTVRTDTLERMATRGDVDLAELKVLAAKVHPGFPFLCSTPLYPEWPMIRTKNADPAVGQAVSTALLAMTATDKAAKAAQIAGWSPVSDYAPVEALLKTLNITAGAE